MALLNPDSVSRELRRFRVAVGYFTRVPMGTISGFSDSDLDHASQYLPWIGLGIGAIAAGVFWFSTLLLPQPAAAVLAVVTGLLMTGCFHEDGLADVCDGFGGGFSPADKLRIMKDSRIGTYGATALWVVLSLRTAILAFLDPVLGVVLLVVAHALSRIAPLVLIYLLDMCRTPTRPGQNRWRRVYPPEDFWWASQSSCPWVSGSCNSRWLQGSSWWLLCCCWRDCVSARLAAIPVITWVFPSRYRKY